MDEVWSSGIYPDIDLAAVTADPSVGLLEVLGPEPAGPAGEIVVDLPDGSAWVVDHADPDQLVRLEVPGDDPAGSPLLIATVGGDNALRIADAARDAGDGVPLRPRTTAPRGWEALAAGQALLQFDLTTDADLSPLTRLAALVALPEEVEVAPVGPLLEDVVLHRLRLAPELAAEVLEELEGPDGPATVLPPGVAQELVAGLYRLAGRLQPLGVERAGVLEVSDLLQRTADFMWGGPDHDQPTRPRPVTDSALETEFEKELVLAAPAMLEGPTVELGEPWLELVGVGHGLVHAPGARTGSWVAVLRAGGLAPLAMVPLRPAGPAELIATVVLPPDVGPGDVELRLLSAVRARRPARSRPGLDAVRRAVRAGRRAARTARVVGPKGARQQWRECAQQWEEAGDPYRAAAARARVTGDRGWSAPPGRALRGRGRLGTGLLADAVAVSLDDV